MNTEQHLRNAANEMERATAPLTPPPISDVRRSARTRGFAIAAAAAVGVAILVGGAVLLVRSPGTRTLDPAGPTVTTATIALEVDGIPVVIPELDPAPKFDLGEGAEEVQFEPLGDSFAEEIRLALDDRNGEWIQSPDRIVFVGASGERSAYSFLGRFGSEVPSYLAGEEGECLHMYVDGHPFGSGCGGSSDWISMGPGVSARGDVATFIVAGRGPEGSSVVVLDIDGDRYWRRTRDGYGFLAIDGSVDARVRYVVYDANGRVLAGTTFYTGPETDWETADTTVTPTDDSCSGSGISPSALALSSIPQPVAETLWNIVDAAGECDFERLAAIGGDTFTASFGGGSAEEVWTYEEEQGYEPMYHLLQILDMPHGTMETESGTLYMWPGAAAHDGDWDTVPEADKEALRPLYDDDDFEGFDQFGAYIGYRVGIWENGDWSFFVAGD